MDLNQPIDIYCERLDPGYWAEPVNALTNIAFLLAALWAWRLAQRRDAADATIGVLVLLTGAIGVASYLFHTLGTAWAGLADSSVIGLFFLAYLYVALLRLFRLSPGVAAAGTLLSAVAIGGFMGAVDTGVSGESAPLNGSLQYLPAVIALLVLTAALRLAGQTAWHAVAAASGCFLVSLTFRTVDMLACPAFPVGTHFLWHLLNGLLLALLLRALILHGRAPGRSREKAIA